MAKMGRPTDSPKTERIEIRITKTDKEKIDFCAGFLSNLPKSLVFSNIHSAKIPINYFAKISLKQN